MSPATTTISLKRSRSSTPSLDLSPSTPDNATELELGTREPHIKQELDHWEKVVFSFGMDDEREHAGPGENPSDPDSYIHGLVGGQNFVPTHDETLLTNPWDVSSLFPTSMYGQPSTYDILALGAANPIPQPASQPDAYGHSAWDLEHLLPQNHHLQLGPLTPAEIAQYHSLIARGAAAFPPPPSTPTEVAFSNQTPGASSSSALAATTPAHIVTTEPTEGRARSNSSVGAGSPVDEETGIAIAEDKRRRNTAASARFRVKKKQRTAELERTLIELEGRADELEKEAVELRKENGWLKEMVILKGRKALQEAKTKGGSTSASQDQPENEDQGGENEQSRGAEGSSKKD